MRTQRGTRQQGLSVQPVKKDAKVAHFWGAAAPSIAELRKLDSRAEYRSGEQRDTRGQLDHGEQLDISEQLDAVIVPSCWGNFQTTALGKNLVDAGHNPQVLHLCDAVAELGPSAAPYSFLVEINRDSTALTLLPWGGNSKQTRLTHTVSSADGEHLVETIIALSYSMIAYPGRALDEAAATEAVGDSGVTRYSTAWRPHVEFIVAQYPPGKPKPRGYSVVDLLHSRRFHAYDVPTNHFAALDGLVATKIQRAKNAGGVEFVNEGLGSRLDAEFDSGEDLVFDSVSMPEESRRDEAPSGLGESFIQRHLRAVAALCTVVLLACCLGIFAIADSRPATRPGEYAVDSTQIPQVPDSSQSVAIPLASPTPSPDSSATQSSSGAPLPRLIAAGVQAEFPQGWSLDPSAPPDKLIAVNGGEMRVVAQVHGVSAGTSLDDVIVRLSVASASQRVSEINRSAIDGMEMVTHVERPASGQTVVLWHHRIEGQTQVSVGCQFRGSTIPVIRTDCDHVVRTAHPM